MKVLVHSKPKSNQSILYDFGKNLTRREFSRLLRRHSIDETISIFAAYAGLSDSVQILNIKGKDRIKRNADVTIYQESQTVKFARIKFPESC